MIAGSSHNNLLHRKEKRGKKERGRDGNKKRTSTLPRRGSRMFNFQMLDLGKHGTQCFKCQASIMRKRTPRRIKEYRGVHLLSHICQRSVKIKPVYLKATKPKGINLTAR